GGIQEVLLLHLLGSLGDDSQGVLQRLQARFELGLLLLRLDDLLPLRDQVRGNRRLGSAVGGFQRIKDGVAVVGEKLDRDFRQRDTLPDTVFDHRYFRYDLGSAARSRPEKQGQERQRKCSLHLQLQHSIRVRLSSQGKS